MEGKEHQGGLFLVNRRIKVNIKSQTITIIKSIS
jgi:hypothetical protein